ncbi:unnamed protein product [Rhizoctonia solani]|uniref:F-box domain-containing protein n=1 Tax=Rhizoctonia solani TaxID=456999 RepID=A0A8H3BBS8_9AGAM|nr:unnamed protein product [Rhizoctonia solani]
MSISTDKSPVERKKQNGELTINRLPPEVLSHILLIGTEFDRQTWRWDSKKARSQHSSSHVCSHWRQVAIGTPSLWAFIHTHGPPDEYTTLCLTRAGDAPLDILIDMFSLVPYPNIPYNPTLGIQPTYDTLQFLTTHGAPTHRWQSLFIRIPESDLLPVFANFFSNNPPTRLQLLRFECTNWVFYHEHDNNEAFLGKLGGVHQVYETGTLLGSSLPSLRELELVSTSASYVHIPKLITAIPTLRSLSIAPSSPYSVDLTELLLSNPQLESVYLQTGYYYGNESRLNKPDRDSIRPVVLPSLRNLYINAVDNARWVVDMLSTIKAPGLYHLAIRSLNQSTFGSEQRENLISYISAGGDIAESGFAGTPAYPLIQSFNIFHFPCKKKEFMRLMTSLPQLTHLIVRGKQAEWLCGAPWMLPKLETLEAPNLTIEEAMGLLRLRKEAGAPLKLIRFYGGYLQLTCLHTEVIGVTCERRPTVLPEYEYFRYGKETGAGGDRQSIQRRSEDFTKEYTDRLEYDLEEDHRDEFFGDD